MLPAQLYFVAEILVLLPHLIFVAENPRFVATLTIFVARTDTFVAGILVLLPSYYLLQDFPVFSRFEALTMKKDETPRFRLLHHSFIHFQYMCPVKEKQISFIDLFLQNAFNGTRI